MIQTSSIFHLQSLETDSNARIAKGTSNCKQSIILLAYLAFSCCLVAFETTAGLLKQEQATLLKGKQEEADAQFKAAETDYLKARALARQLPPRAYHVETEQTVSSTFAISLRTSSSGRMEQELEINSFGGL